MRRRRKSFGINLQERYVQSRSKRYKAVFKVTTVEKLCECDITVNLNDDTNEFSKQREFE